MDAYKNLDVVLVMWWDGCYTQNVTPGGITSGGHHLRGASPPGGITSGQREVVWLQIQR